MLRFSGYRVVIMAIKTTEVLSAGIGGYARHGLHVRVMRKSPNLVEGLSFLFCHGFAGVALL